MKRFFASMLLVTVLAGFTACQKEEIPTPATTNTPATAMQVEYKIRGNSGNLTVEYIQADANGLPQTIKETTSRNETSIAFAWKSGNFLFVKASNTTPSHEEVIVEIYINGELKKAVSANAPGAIAIAEGRW